MVQTEDLSPRLLVDLFRDRFSSKKSLGQHLLVDSEIIDHARMNMPGQNFYRVLAESALRAIQLCQPLRVPSTGYERWKDLQLNFDAREMLEG